MSEEFLTDLLKEGNKILEKEDLGITEKHICNGKVTYFCSNCNEPADEPFEECGICGLKINDCNICQINSVCSIKAHFEYFLSYKNELITTNIKKGPMITALAQNCKLFKKVE